jgi:predicted heme/steroid binding protein
MSTGCPSQNDQLKCVRYKRNFKRLLYITFFDCWNNPPQRLYAHYDDFDEGQDMSNPIKINHRKNGTTYFQFEGKRYDIYMQYNNDVQWTNIIQWFNYNGKNKILIEKGYYN